MDNKVVEPLCFPLLFFNGEDGWGSNHNDRVPFPKYMTSRILVPEAELTMPALQQNDSGPPRLLKCNRFQALSRAFQTWIVSTYSRALDYRLEWARSHQDEIMCGEVRRVKKRKVKKRSHPRPAVIPDQIPIHVMKNVLTWIHNPNLFLIFCLDLTSAAHGICARRL